MWLTGPEMARKAGVDESVVRDRGRRGKTMERKGKPGRYVYRVIGDMQERLSDRPQRPAGKLPLDDEEAIAELIRGLDKAKFIDPPAKPKSEIRTAVILSDVHIPDHDVRVWRAAMEYIGANKPDEVILLGDFGEFESCSQHGGVARPASLVEDCRAVKECLGQIRYVHDGAITYIGGNHEDRLARITVNNLPTFDGAIDLPSLLDLDSFGITYVPYGSVVDRGKLSLTHGWWTNLHHAKKHLDQMNQSIAYGHTHKPQMFTRGSGHGVQGAFGLPCMRTLDAGWCKGAPHGWSQGFGILDVSEDTGDFWLMIALAQDGRVSIGGRVYG